MQLTPSDDVHFTSRAEATYILHYGLKQSHADPYQDYVDTQAPYVTSSAACTPPWRGDWQISIDDKAYTLNATAYYTSGYKAVAFDQKAAQRGHHAAVNCNPTYTQIGAVGRTMRVGANF